MKFFQFLQFNCNHPPYPTHHAQSHKASTSINYDYRVVKLSRSAFFIVTNAQRTKRTPQLQQTLPTPPLPHTTITHEIICAYFIQITPPNHPPQGGGRNFFYLFACSCRFVWINNLLVIVECKVFLRLLTGWHHQNCT